VNGHGLKASVASVTMRQVLQAASVLPKQSGGQGATQDGKKAVRVDCKILRILHSRTHHEGIIA